METNSTSKVHGVIQGSSIDQRKQDGDGVASGRDRQTLPPPRGYTGEARKDGVTRPCAVIEPETVGHSYIRKEDVGRAWTNSTDTEPGTTTPYYHAPYYPPRNISPRQSFQENMSRIVVPSPSELKNYQDYGDTNSSINPMSSKFNEGSVLVKSSLDMLRSPYYPSPASAVEYQRHAEYSGPRIQVIKGAQIFPKVPDQNTYVFPTAPNYPCKAYTRVNGIRYDPYTQYKDKYVQPSRYNYTTYQYPTHVSPVAAIEKFNEAKKRLGQTPEYPVRYFPPHTAMPSAEYQHKVPPPVPVRRHSVATHYVEGASSGAQVDIYQPSQPKVYGYNASDKIAQYNHNLRTSQDARGQHYYSQYNALSYQEPRLGDPVHSNSFSKGPVHSVNYSSVSANTTSYQKSMEAPYERTLDYDTYYRYHQKPQQPAPPYNPLENIPTQFSPNIISPAESSASCNSITTLPSQSLEDGGYVSQCSTSSGRSSNPNTLNIVGKDNFLEPSRSKIDQISRSSEGAQSKKSEKCDNKKSLKQFYSTWVVDELEDSLKSQDSGSAAENPLVIDCAPNVSDVNVASVPPNNVYASGKNSSLPAQPAYPSDRANVPYTQYFVNLQERPTSMPHPVPKHHSYGMQSSAKTFVTSYPYPGGRSSSVMPHYAPGYFSEKSHANSINLNSPVYHSHQMYTSERIPSSTSVSRVSMAPQPYTSYSIEKNNPPVPSCSVIEKSHVPNYNVYSNVPSSRAYAVDDPGVAHITHNASRENSLAQDYLKSSNVCKINNQGSLSQSRNVKTNIKPEKSLSNTVSGSRISNSANGSTPSNPNESNLNELIDVEAKISQSIIHKDVASNCGAKPIEMKIEIAPGYNPNCMENTTANTEKEQTKQIANNNSNDDYTSIRNTPQQASKQNKMEHSLQYSRQCKNIVELDNNQPTQNEMFVNSKDNNCTSKNMLPENHTICNPSVGSAYAVESPIQTQAKPSDLNFLCKQSSKADSSSGILQNASQPNNENNNNIFTHVVNNDSSNITSIVHEGKMYMKHFEHFQTSESNEGNHNLKQDLLKNIKPAHETVLKYVSTNNVQHKSMDLSNCKAKVTYSKPEDLDIESEIGYAVIDMNSNKTNSKMIDSDHKRCNNYSTGNVIFPHSNEPENNLECRRAAGNLEKTPFSKASEPTNETHQTFLTNECSESYQLCGEVLSSNYLERTKSTNEDKKCDLPAKQCSNNNAIKHNIDNIILTNSSVADVTNLDFRYDSSLNNSDFDSQIVATDLSLKNYDHFEYIPKESNKTAPEVFTVDIPLKTPEIVDERLQEMGFVSRKSAFSETSLRRDSNDQTVKEHGKHYISECLSVTDRPKRDLNNSSAKSDNTTNMNKLPSLFDDIETNVTFEESKKAGDSLENIPQDPLSENKLNHSVLNEADSGEIMKYDTKQNDATGSSFNDPAKIHDSITPTSDPYNKMIQHDVSLEQKNTESDLYEKNINLNKNNTIVDDDGRKDIFDNEKRSNNCNDEFGKDLRNNSCNEEVENNRNRETSDVFDDEVEKETRSNNCNDEFGKDLRNNSCNEVENNGNRETSDIFDDEVKKEIRNDNRNDEVRNNIFDGVAGKDLRNNSCDDEVRNNIRNDNCDEVEKSFRSSSCIDEDSNNIKDDIFDDDVDVENILPNDEFDEKEKDVNDYVDKIVDEKCTDLNKSDEKFDEYTASENCAVVNKDKEKLDESRPTHEERDEKSDKINGAIFNNGKVDVSQDESVSIDADEPINVSVEEPDEDFTVNGDDEPINVSVEEPAKDFAVNGDDEPINVSVEEPAKDFAVNGDDEPMNVLVEEAEKDFIVNGDDEPIVSVEEPDEDFTVNDDDEPINVSMEKPEKDFTVNGDDAIEPRQSLEKDDIEIINKLEENVSPELNSMSEKAASSELKVENCNGKILDDNISSDVLIPKDKSTEDNNDTNIPSPQEVTNFDDGKETHLESDKKVENKIIESSETDEEINKLQEKEFSLVSSSTETEQTSDAYTHADISKEDSATEPCHEQHSEIQLQIANDNQENVSFDVIRQHIESQYHSFQLAIDPDLISTDGNILYCQIEPTSPMKCDDNEDKYYLQVDDALADVIQRGQITVLPGDDSYVVSNVDKSLIHDDSCVPWIDDVACVETVISEETMCDDKDESQEAYTPEPLWGPNSVSMERLPEDELSLSSSPCNEILIHSDTKDADYTVITNDSLLDVNQNNVSENEFESLSLAMSTEDHSSSNFAENFLKTATSLPPPRCDYDQELMSVLMDDADDFKADKQDLMSVLLGEDEDEHSACSTAAVVQKQAANKRQPDGPILYVPNKTIKQTHDSSEEESSEESSSDSEYSDCSSHKDTYYNNESSQTPSKLLTKGAQKYIPPVDVSYHDFKCQLPLPPEKLLLLKKHLEKKNVQYEEKIKNNTGDAKNNVVKENNIIGQNKKVVKPKFDDVLKNIDETNMTWCKMKMKKSSKSIPKMVIKKSEEGSLYTTKVEDKPIKLHIKAIQKDTHEENETKGSKHFPKDTTFETYKISRRKSVASKVDNDCSETPKSIRYSRRDSICNIVDTKNNDDKDNFIKPHMGRNSQKGSSCDASTKSKITGVSRREMLFEDSLEDVKKCQSKENLFDCSNKIDHKKLNHKKLSQRRQTISCDYVNPEIYKKSDREPKSKSDDLAKKTNLPKQTTSDEFVPKCDKTQLKQPDISSGRKISRRRMTVADGNPITELSNNTENDDFNAYKMYQKPKKTSEPKKNDYTDSANERNQNVSLRMLPPSDSNLSSKKNKRSHSPNDSEKELCNSKIFHKPKPVLKRRMTVDVNESSQPKNSKSESFKYEKFQNKVSFSKVETRKTNEDHYVKSDKTGFKRRLSMSSDTNAKLQNAKEKSAVSKPEIKKISQRRMTISYAAPFESDGETNSHHQPDNTGKLFKKKMTFCYDMPKTENEDDSSDSSNEEYVTKKFGKKSDKTKKPSIKSPQTIEFQNSPLRSKNNNSVANTNKTSKPKTIDYRGKTVCNDSMMLEKNSDRYQKFKQSCQIDRESENRNYKYRPTFISSPSRDKSLRKSSATDDGFSNCMESNKTSEKYKKPKPSRRQTVSFESNPYLLNYSDKESTSTTKNNANTIFSCDPEPYIPQKVTRRDLHGNRDPFFEMFPRRIENLLNRVENFDYGMGSSNANPYTYIPSSCTNKRYDSDSETETNDKRRGSYNSSSPDHDDNSCRDHINSSQTNMNVELVRISYNMHTTDNAKNRESRKRVTVCYDNFQQRPGNLRERRKSTAFEHRRERTRQDPPDLTGRRWQPYVTLRKNIIVEEMIQKNKSKISFYGDSDSSPQSSNALIDKESLTSADDEEDEQNKSISSSSSDCENSTSDSDKCEDVLASQKSAHSNS